MEQTSVSNNSPLELINQDYSIKDVSLLNEYEVNREFGAEQDVVELHVFSSTNQLLNSNHNFKDYNTQVTKDDTSLFNTLYLDPEKDVKSAGFNVGKYNTGYFFYRTLFLSNIDRRFFIKEISQDRTEIKIATNELSYDALGTSYFNYITSKQGKSFYSDLLLNFGNNQTLIGVNTLLDTANPSEPSIYIKLYEPLPVQFGLKDTLWCVEEVSEPISFNVDIQFISEEVEEFTYLRGPNTNIDLNSQVNSTTNYLNVNEILNTSLTSSFQQLKSYLEEKSIDISIDHEEYSNFVHFSSAYERLENFKYKLNLIQSYQGDLNSLKSISELTDDSYVSASKATLQDNIDTLIEKFDNYEYYLYYTSGSKAWPKTTNSPPYTNQLTSTTSSLEWFGSVDEESTYYGGQILSASLYDEDNRNYIWNTLPSYIKDDPQNQNLELLVAMLGQHYDYIWTYIRGIGDLKNADNRPDYGVSKDMVADALRSLGIKLYTSDRTNQDIYTSILGLTPSGGLVPDTGSYRIENYISASNNQTSYDDLNKEVYKRIYHNLPYLLKTKGSYRGLRALLNCFGIADFIIRIKEYGGNKKNVREVNQLYENGVYALNTNSSSMVNVPWLPTLIPMLPELWEEMDYDWNDIEGWWNGTLTIDSVADELEFRFKTKGIPTSSHHTQSIFQVNNSDSSSQFGVQLLYPTESLQESGSGFERHGELRFILSGSQGYKETVSIFLPFFSASWFNVRLGRNPGKGTLDQTGSVDVTYKLDVRGAEFEGSADQYIKYTGSAEFTIDAATSASYNEAWSYYDFVPDNNYFRGWLGGASSSNVMAPDGVLFDGYFQEFRIWMTNLSSSALDQHVLNPTSYVGNNYSSSYNDLIYRLGLGNDLLTSSAIVPSIHPMVTGSNAPTASFLGTGSTTVSYGIITNFSNASFEEENRTDLIQAADIGALVQNEIKVRPRNVSTISGSTLSPYVSIQDDSIDEYTADLDSLEVAISPQDSINKDITDQMGWFDIDDFIGDPKLAPSSSYKDLENLRNFYFVKYTKKQNIFEYVKALSYFDSSLFKMIKDFVPAKSTLTTGLLIKPHMLERNKSPKFEPAFTYIDYTGSIAKPEVIGSNPMDANLNTSYTANIKIPSSSADTITEAYVTYNFNDSREPFTGEYSGSELTVYSQPTTSVVVERSFFNVENDNDTFVSYSNIPLNPTLNNISEARKSVQYMDIDYSSNLITPVNIGFITSRSFNQITEADTPFLDAPIQDSNYTLLRNVNPRYLGSKTTSAKYNDYTIGDKSYGSTAAIDLNSLKFAYFAEVVETGSLFPERSNVYLKYLIDGRSNVTELTRKNESIFELQNIFSSKQQANISLDNNQLFSDQKYLDGLKPIYAGGFRYLSCLQNPTGSNTLIYKFTTGSLSNVTTEDLKELPGSLGGDFVKISNFTLGTIQIQSGSNSVSFGGYPAITLTRNEPVNQSTVWWDNDLVINFEGELEIEVTIPKNVSASIDNITWNPFNGESPLVSSSIDLGDTALVKATYHISNSATLPKNTNTSEVLLDNAVSAIGGRFESIFDNPQFSSASLNIGRESARYSEPEYTYYYPSEPIVSLTSSIVDGGDADRNDAFFIRNNTGSFNILTASVSMSYWYGNFVQTSSVQEGYPVVDEEFAIQQGDLFRFYDSASGEFPKEFERQVKRVNLIPRDEVTDTRRLTIEFNRDIPARACSDFGSVSSPEDATEIKHFVILKKVPDETNIVLDFAKQPGQTSSGIVLPADISKTLKEKAGNIVKQLKAQNLIS